MRKKNSFLLRTLALCLVLAMCLGLASCGKKPEETKPSVGTEKVTYTLVLKTEGGKALADVGVYFYTDSTLAELVWFAKTDAAGAVSFTDLESTGYVAVLDNVPEGYKVEPQYPLTGEVTEIVLATDMADGDLASLSYKLGDVMMNFSVTDVDGKTWVLSDLLAEKKAVVLNFWYVQCAPCKMEFPYLQEAYEAYSDKIALIAMNPINESREEIAAFAVENGLTFPMAHCDPAWEKAMQLTAYPTTVIIDRFGTIALIHKGGVDETKVFTDAFEFFTADDYKQTVVENIADLEIKAQGSDSSNPIEIGGKLSFDVTVEPGQMVYYHIYRVDGLTLTVNNRDIYAVYNETTYEPKGGTIEFTLRCADTYTPAAVAFGNSGEETETFTVRLSAKPGTVNNPYNLKLGEFSVKVSAGNDQGVYHSFTPQESGLLTVQCTSVDPSNVKYGISLTTQKGNATVQRNLEEDGNTETGTLTISVTKGVKVQIVISTLPDDSKSYPAATLKCTLSLGEDTTGGDEDSERITYAVTVTDQDTIPIPNVKMELKKTEVAEEPEDATEGTTGTTVKPDSLSTNEWGVAYITKDAGTYEVTISLPIGYDGATTQFRLTEDRPYATIKLNEVVVEMKTYTVTVTDAYGNPLPGAMVTIGNDFATTDDTGKVSFELPKYAYTVYVTAPSGYAAKDEGYAFDGENTDLTIALEEGSSEEGPDTGEEKFEYTVTVVDYDGNAQSGVMVRILKNGAPAATCQTDENGMATANLASADYTVSLAFSGTKLYYEEKLAVLPKGTTNLTIRVAPAIASEPQEEWFGTIRYLELGGNYATIQSNAVNYFVFEPTQAGLYRFSVSDLSAPLSYQGGSMFFVQDMTSSTDYNPRTNSFTRNWKEGNIGGIIVLGVTGADDCIIEVTRVGDPILDETDMTMEVYKPKTAPKAFKINAAQGRKLTYVDMTGKTGDYQIVMGSDGYYHLNSATGPLLYMNIGPNAPFHSLYHMAGAGGNGVAGTGIKATVYDENGVAVQRLDFSECMLAYGECADPTYGVYPLTEDLVYMVQTAGEYYGWWDSASSNFWLDTVTNLNPELGWMFAVCYVP